MYNIGIVSITGVARNRETISKVCYVALGGL